LNAYAASAQVVPQRLPRERNGTAARNRSGKPQCAPVWANRKREGFACLIRAE
jgi:hypothetical protein